MTQRPEPSPWTTPNRVGGAHDLAGRRVGDFQVLRRLGMGAMAEVYLAEQLSLKRQVALKVLLPDRAADPGYVRRFRIEAQAAAALAHGNIVQIYDVGRVDDVHYIAQEYVAGLNLRQLLARQGPADARLAVAVLRQAAAALHKAAEHGIVHRDIKPENIMLTRDGVVKVADFGLARIMGDEQGLNLTRVGVTLGTPLYMSPEQVEGRPLEPSSDIYSLGVTIYHMLAGQPPFTGDNALGVAVQHLQKAPPPLAEQRPDLPAELCEVVHKMLAKTPADRYRTALELIADLRTIPLSSGDSTHLLDDTNFELPFNRTSWAATQRLDAVLHTRAMQVVRRRRWPWVIAVVVIFLAGTAGGWAMRERPLLEASDVDQRIERMSTAEQQYQSAAFLAMFSDDEGRVEAAWKAVLDNFPEEQNPLHVRRAKQQLARFYWKRDRSDEALAMFDQLAALDESEREFKAFGIAGQCMIYFHRADLARAGEMLVRLQPLVRNLEDAELRASISDEVYPRLREKLPTPEAEAWDAFIGGLNRGT